MTHHDIVADVFHIEPGATLDGGVCVICVASLYLKITVFNYDRRLQIRSDHSIQQQPIKKECDQSALTRAKLER